MMKTCDHSDAPVYFDNEGASAWASGYNSAVLDANTLLVSMYKEIIKRANFVGVEGGDLYGKEYVDINLDDLREVFGMNAKRESS